MADAAGEKRARSPLFWVLLAVAALGCAGLGAAILFVVATPSIAQAIERAEQSACMADLRGVYQDLIQYHTAYNTNGKGAAALQAWWADKQGAIEPASSYAWRDMQAFPLERFPGTDREPLAACAVDPRHTPDVMHVLYTDGSIDTLTLAELQAEGIVPAETDVVRVGPDSPVPELRKLTRD